MAEASKGDFSPYLDELEKRTSSWSPSEESGSAMQVLRQLVGGPMTLRELQEGSGLGFDAFAATLRSLQAAGYVEVVGKPSEEVSSLTEEGRKVAQIALS